MQFVFTDEQTEIEKMFGGFRHINAFGKIQVGDADRLLKLVTDAEVPPRTTVYINSTGGDLEEGIKLGYVIRECDLETSIGTYVLDPQNNDDPIVHRKFTHGKCYSAATLMFAGGRLRHYSEGSKFGVHRFSFKDPTIQNVEKSQELSASIANFLDQMGIALSFLSASAAIASDQLAEMTEETLVEHNMVTGGITEVVWGTEMKANMLYVRGTRDSIFGQHKVILAHSQESGFMFFAIIEAQGRQEALCAHGLVEIVINGEDQRIDISDRCFREPNNIDVVLMSNITSLEAAQIAYSDSFGVQIRFCAESEMFLGISAMDTTGGKDSLVTLYKSMK